MYIYIYIYIYIHVSFKPTNINGCYHYAHKTVTPVFCKYMEKNKIKIKNQINKQMIVSTSIKVPTDDCFSRPINR